MLRYDAAIRPTSRIIFLWAISAVSFLLYSVLRRFIPPSLRWLLIKEKVDMACQVANTINSYNSLKLDPSSLRLEMETIINVKNSSVKSKPVVSSSDKFILNSLLISFVCICTSLFFHDSSSHYGIITGVSSFDRLLIPGLCTVAAPIASLLTSYLGRRTSLCILFCLRALTDLLTILVSEVLTESVFNKQLVLSLLPVLGQLCIVSVITLLLLFVCEISPTVVRSTYLGTFFCLSVSVLILSSYLKPLLLRWSPVIQLSTNAFLSLVCGGLVFLLPETHDTDLPDTFEEAIELSVRARKSSASLDVGYGKCPEFVCVDGLIISKDNAWTDMDYGEGSTVGTLRSGISSIMESDSTQENPVHDELSSFSSQDSERDKIQLRRSIEKMEDDSVVSAESSISYEPNQKSDTIMELMKMRLLEMDGVGLETRL